MVGSIKKWLVWELNSADIFPWHVFPFHNWGELYASKLTFLVLLFQKIFLSVFLSTEVITFCPPQIVFCNILFHCIATFHGEDEAKNLQSDSFERQKRMGKTNQ
jgi:hypothetical protein